MSLPRYPKYKDSGVAWLGEVPAHWEVSALKRLIDIQNGADYKPVEAVEGYPVIGSGGQFAYASDYLYDGDSVLLGRKGTIDRPLYVTGKFWTVDTMYWSRIRPNACGRFCYYVATTIPFGLYSTNTALPSMTKGALEAHLVATPPLAEQSAIAAFLDRETAKIDALIAEQERLIALLAEKRQATISHAVTRGLNPNAPMKDSGVPWLGEVPAHWDLPPLYLRYSSELGKMLDASRITGRALVPYLRNVDVQWDAINYSNLPVMDIDPGEFARYTVREGDLLVCEGGEVGRAAVVHCAQEVIGYQKALHRLRALTEEECPRYMFYTFAWASKAGVFSGEGQSTIAHLTGEQLRRYRFPRPPKVDQELIVGFLDIEISKISKLRSMAEAAITLLKERRSALIAAAVTGQIDVRQAA